MGLGKTIEALAAISHLASTGDTHFLVVCPASVIVNWENEIYRHSRLTAHRLHGPAKDRAFSTWTSDGGVAIATFSGAGGFSPTDRVDVSLLGDPADRRFAPGRAPWEFSELELRSVPIR